MQKRCLTCRKVPEKSLSEGERKDSCEGLPSTTALWPFLCYLSFGCQVGHVKEKHYSVDLCNFFYLISGLSNTHCLQMWRHHVGNGVNLNQSHCVMIGIGLSMFLSNLSSSGV